MKECRRATGTCMCAREREVGREGDRDRRAGVGERDMWVCEGESE